MIERSTALAVLQAAIAHFGINFLVSALIGSVVFFVWFPYPFRELADIPDIFWILIAIAMTCGPILTTVVFHPRKLRRELKFDLSLIVSLQLAVFGYGLHILSLTRPVALVFETDRMVSVSAASILPSKGDELSWTGPILLGTRQPRDGQEMLESVALSLQGIEPSARPGWWQDYALSIPVIQKKMKPLQSLHTSLSADQQRTLDGAVQQTKLPMGQLHYLPLVAGKNLDGWIALLDGSAQVVGFAPVGGFN